MLLNRFAHSAGPWLGGSESGLEAPGFQARGRRVVLQDGDDVLEEGEEEEGDEGKTRRTTRRWGSQPACLHFPQCLAFDEFSFGSQFHCISHSFLRLLL